MDKCNEAMEKCVQQSVSALGLGAINANLNYDTNNRNIRKMIKRECNVGSCRGPTYTYHLQSGTLLGVANGYKKIA